jgi:IS5 family transposase
VPDAATLLKFRRLLQDNDLNRALFEETIAHLAQQPPPTRSGSSADETIIDAPSSTKNEDKVRNPEEHQTKKGTQWQFGMNAHIGVDAESDLVHTMIATAANAFSSSGHTAI